MILLISAQKPELDGPVDHRFGRSAWLIKMDTDTKKWEAFPNPGASQSSGAGVAAAQFVINQNINTVISGDFGPHAANAFKAAKIKMFLFPAGEASVEQVVEQFEQGNLLPFS